MGSDMANDDHDSPADEISLIATHDESQIRQSLQRENESNSTHISETQLASQLAQIDQEELGDARATGDRAIVTDITTEPHAHAGSNPLKAKFFVRPISLEGPSTSAFFAFRQAPKAVLNMAINAGGQGSFGLSRGK